MSIVTGGTPSSGGAAAGQAWQSTQKQQAGANSELSDFHKFMAEGSSGGEGTARRPWWPGSLGEFWTATWAKPVASEAPVSERNGSPTAMIQNGTAGSETDAAAANGEHEGLAKLRELLVNSGITESDVELRYVEQEVWCPMVRAWINHLIVAECANGRRLTFDADLTARTPQVTLNSINDMLNEVGITGVNEAVPT